MYSKCCVPGCANTRKDTLLHKFLKCEKRLKIWLDQINCDSLRNKDLGKLQVCHTHFENRFLTAKSGLRIIAYPTLFLTSDKLSVVPINSSDGSPSYLIDHTYVKRIHCDHSYHCQYLPESQRIIETPESLPSTSSNNSRSETATISMTDTEPKLEVSTRGSASVKRNRKYVSNIEAMTPNCRKLYDMYRKSRKLLSYTRRAKKLLEFSKKNSFEEKVAGMNPLAQQFLLMQLKLCKIKKKARRFTLNEKLIALSIQKQGPKSYRFLQKIFILPSATTLKKFVSSLNINSGINEKIFECICILICINLNKWTVFLLV